MDDNELKCEKRRKKRKGREKDEENEKDENKKIILISRWARGLKFGPELGYEWQ